MESNIKKISVLVEKFYNVFYFMFWGYYYCAGYFFCKKTEYEFLMSDPLL